MSNDILVIIPNFNGARFIEETINRLSYALPEYPILVVDDRSTDNSLQLLNSIGVNVISKERNGGFASSVNVGLNFALGHGYQAALVFNSDIFLDVETGVAIESEIRKFLDDETLHVLGFLEAGSEALASNFEDENISGFLFCLKLIVPKSIGLFDEVFYMYGEEQDFFRRTVSAGFRINQSKIVVTHKTEGSSNSKSFVSFLAMRNSIYLELKRKKYLVALKSVLIILSILFRLRHRGSKDPSILRMQRPKFFNGLGMLTKAVFWNLRFLWSKSFEP